MILISTMLPMSNSFSSVHFYCQGIKARILETFVMLFLLALLILGIVWVASALIDNDAASMESLYGTFLRNSVTLMHVNHVDLKGISCVFSKMLNYSFSVHIEFHYCFSFCRSLGILPAIPLLLYISDGRTAFTQ